MTSVVELEPAVLLDAHFQELLDNIHQNESVSYPLVSGTFLEVLDELADNPRSPES